MSQEPYKKVGRGGAGNFYSKQDVERSNGTSPRIGSRSPIFLLFHQAKQISLLTLTGIARQRRRWTTARISTFVPHPSLIPSKRELAHTSKLDTGRGGAGNLTSPASLVNSGLTQTLTNYDNPTINPAPPSSSPRNVRSSMQSVVYKGGRGGAGNYDWESDEASRETQRVSEESSRKEIEKKVVGDIDGDGEQGLKKPGKAYDINAGKEMEGSKGGA
ncbi:hypothetical protein BCON_0513g00040 [Botryotinia convoluta]|uniref:Uncharacterized protein n=1 Tax=Botryotinia convoluta TaxID=54673 RepID=A0A4Z1HCP3_9HELO|nr:hypothetical protein BCON_0513g00040 [Botryotinia convoluta]